MNWSCQIAKQTPLLVWRTCLLNLLFATAPSGSQRIQNIFFYINIMPILNSIKSNYARPPAVCVPHSWPEMGSTCWTSVDVLWNLHSRPCCRTLKDPVHNLILHIRLLLIRNAVGYHLVFSACEDILMICTICKIGDVCNHKSSKLRTLLCVSPWLCV